MATQIKLISMIMIIRVRFMCSLFGGIGLFMGFFFVYGRILVSGKVDGSLNDSLF